MLPLLPVSLTNLPAQVSGRKVSISAHCCAANACPTDAGIPPFDKTLSAASPNCPVLPRSSWDPGRLFSQEKAALLGWATGCVQPLKARRACYGNSVVQVLLSISDMKTSFSSSKLLAKLLLFGFVFFFLIYHSLRSF